MPMADEVREGTEEDGVMLPSLRCRVGMAVGGGIVAAAIGVRACPGRGDRCSAVDRDSEDRREASEDRDTVR